MSGNRETATKQFHSLLHGADPNMFAWAIDLKQGPWFETTAPILHLQANVRILTLQDKTSLPGVRVLTYIGERFLSNSEQRGLNRSRQALWSERLFKNNCPAIVTLCLDLQAQSRCQPEIVQDRWP